VIGLAEGVGVVFVWVDTSTLMIELKSGQVSKVSDSGVFYSALPFMSFHASGTVSTVLSANLKLTLKNTSPLNLIWKSSQRSR
jgi:hypothetical protein